MSSLPSALGSLPPHHLSKSGWFGPKYECHWAPGLTTKSLIDVCKWMQERKRFPGAGHLTDNKDPKPEDFEKAFPLTAPDARALGSPAPGAIQATWVGHATVLVQMTGVAFITDPIFSQRCSPFQFMGPKRVVPPALDAASPALPALDFVLVSHNHFDHLDEGSVRALNQRFGMRTTWYVPLGVKHFLTKWGVKKVVEMDWWQEVEHFRTKATTTTTAEAAATTAGGAAGAAGSSSSGSGKPAAAAADVTVSVGASAAAPAAGGQQQQQQPSAALRIAYVPAQHWSARGLMDRNHSLWGGYVVTDDATGQRFYFVGDTGYAEPVFKEIGERYGPIDLSAIPTGAYEPRWFMSAQHVNPAEAVQLHLDVRSKCSMAIHCCTFSLTDEPLDEPPALLVRELRDRGLDAASFLTVQHGQTMVVRDGRVVNEPKTLPLVLPPAQQQP